MEPGNCGASHYASRVDIALPVHVANDPAFAESPSALQNCVGAVRKDLRQDQGPSPTCGAMPGWIGAVFAQRLLIVRGTAGAVVHGKRPYALIVGLCPIGGEADIDESLAEQCVEPRRALFRDRQVCRTGECLRSMREVKIGITDRPRPARRIAEFGGSFTRGLVIREAGRVRCWGRREERQAVWQSRWVEVSMRSTGRQIRNAGGSEPQADLRIAQPAEKVSLRQPSVPLPQDMKDAITSAAPRSSRAVVARFRPAHFTGLMSSSFHVLSK